MAVMTHARIQPDTANYAALATYLQDSFDGWMEDADAAGTTDAYRTAMACAAATAGIRLPASGDIALCSCYTDAAGCGCPLIFDSNAAGAVPTAPNAPGFNLSHIQCPTCGHDHPRRVQD